MKRLTPASLTLIMFLVIGGLLVAYVAKGLIGREIPKPKIAQRNIPMAMTDIKPGTVLTEQHVGLGPILESELRTDMLLNNRVIVGRVVKEALTTARPIRASQLYEPGAGPPLELEGGMQAVTIDFPAGSAIVEGFIKPGEYCDVHMTVTDVAGDERFRGGFTLTLFKGVRILAINRMTQQPKVERDGNTVTLELTPMQANIAILAKKYQLTLTSNPNGKGTGGIAVADADRVTLDELLGLRPKAPPSEPFTAQIYLGKSRQTIQFIGNNQVVDFPVSGNRPIPDAPRGQTAPPAASAPLAAPAAAPTAAPSQPSAMKPIPLDAYMGHLRFADP